MSVAAGDHAELALNRASANGMVELDVTFRQYDGTTATTYINDDIVACVLEDVLTASEDTLIISFPGAKPEHAPRRVRAFVPRRRAIDCPREE